MADVGMNLRVSDYTSRVLGVVKEKFGLKDKSEALDKFADMFGDGFIEKEVNDKIAAEVISSCETHIKKYGYRKMPLEELRKLCGMK